MTYYPDWIDYLTYSSAAAGILCALATLPLPTGQKRGRLKLAACLLLAIGAVSGGTGGILFNLRAPHLRILGSISGVVIHSGKGSYTRFRVTDSFGHFEDLHLSSAVDAVANSETAEVIYQQSSNEVLALSILGGPNQGYSTTHQDGSFASILVIIIGLILGIYGVINFLSDGQATTRADTQPAIDGDVDPASALHLYDEAPESNSTRTNNRPAPSDADEDSILHL